MLCAGVPVRIVLVLGFEGVLFSPYFFRTFDGSATIQDQRHHLRPHVSSAIVQETHTAVAALDGSERVEEIARMLGGLDLTEQALAHARQMIGTAQTS